MKLITLLAAALISPLLVAQETVTVTTGPSNSLQSFYSLENGLLDTRPLAEWDLAFEISGFTASILVNTAKGIQAFKAPYAVASWASLDTAGMASGWTRIHNSDTSWSHGALNQGLTSNEFDLGWGVYNVITHIVMGDSIFVLKLANQQWKKLRIDGLASSTYTFTWADLDGSNEQTGTLSKGPYMGKNFGYYSLENNTAIDREPLTANWDMLFTKYVAFIPSAYPVAGVLLNKNVTALRVEDTPPAQATWVDGAFTSHINTIGYDWKTFNMQTFQFEYDEELTFFVNDQAGSLWKLIFIGYGGTANGEMTFTQELVSATSVQSGAASTGVFSIYPNPARHGTVQLVIDQPVQSAVLSIHDMNGRLVLQQNIAGLQGPSLRSLPVDMLGAGLYVVRLEGQGVSASSRLVIE
jgi:hypothetical protein